MDDIVVKHTTSTIPCNHWAASQRMVKGLTQNNTSANTKKQAYKTPYGYQLHTRKNPKPVRGTVLYGKGTNYGVDAKNNALNETRNKGNNIEATGTLYVHLHCTSMERIFAN